jgi:4-amino-4-deoxy-L-arabinose transferase-like glycosyltransferase
MVRGARHTAKIDAEKEVNLLDVYPKFKKYVPLMLLAAFLIIGFGIRYYHINYPVIGYHNWKSAHYITEARNFARDGFFEAGFFVPMRDTFNSIDEPPLGEHNDTFPTISIVVAILFRIFGESLFIARMANILFSLGAVVFAYLLVKRLFKKESLALLTAFLFSVCPLFVFFSHNVDVINPGLFFMMLGAYLYVLWLDNIYVFRNLYLAALFIMLSVITKYTFIVIGLPILFSFPYKDLKNWKRLLLPFTLAGFIISLFPAWFLYSEYYLRPTIFGKIIGDSPSEYSLSSLVDFGIIFDNQFWTIMKSYVADNYTLLGTVLFLIGSIVFVLLFTKNKENTGYRFMLGFLASVPIFVFVMGFKLSGHNYHQFPVAPVVIFMVAYLIDVIARNVSKIASNEKIRMVIHVGIVLLFLFAPLSSGKGLLANGQESIGRMFNTQFPGLDIAGDYIRAHSLPNERFFHSSGQSFGVLWHAGIKGYKPPGTAEQFRRGEDEFNVTWVFVYQWGFNTYFQNPEVSRYLMDNYRIVQAAFVQQDQQARPIYFLFRKGGSFNESALGEMIQGKPMFIHQYNNTHGPYEIVYVNLE